VDSAPEFTGAKNFADAFPGRVYLADFTGDEDGIDTVIWPSTRARRQKGETANPYQVRLARTRVLHWSVHQWKYRRVEVPPLRRLVQKLPVATDGTIEFSAHLRQGREGDGHPAEALKAHLCRFVFRDIVEDDAKKGPKQLTALKQGKKRWVAEWVEGSPDLAFADMYASVAMSRYADGGAFVPPRREEG